MGSFCYNFRLAALGERSFLVAIQHISPPSAERIFYFESKFFLAPEALKKTSIQNIYSLRRSRNNYAE
jgi:hypothetical protein